MISKAGRDMGSEAAALSVAPMRRLNPYNGLGFHSIPPGKGQFKLHAPM